MDPLDRRLAHALLQLGVLLFLAGLLVGLAASALPNPRMGLTAHLEGVMNGMVLVGLGLLWPKLVLGRAARNALMGVAVWGTWANWLATLIAALWSAGGTMMPITASEHVGNALQEGVVGGLLISVAITMVTMCVIVLWGLRKGPDLTP